MTAILERVKAESLIGVIDLMGGRAVHAVAGQRDRYSPIRFCDGDATKLVAYYRQLGIQSFYVADLDAIAGCEWRDGLLGEIATQAEGDLLVDCGWSGAETVGSKRAMRALLESKPSLRWIAATESCHSLRSLAELAEFVAPENILLGLDYRNGQLLVRNERERAEALWLRQSAELRFPGMVVLDLAFVGTRRGPATLEQCRRIKAQYPQALLYSGGGLHTAADVDALIESGCDRFLVATGVYPQN